MSMTKNAIKDFETYFPELSKHVKEYKTNKFYELFAMLDNEFVIFYDYLEKTIRYIPKDSSNLEEQDYRYLLGIRLRNLLVCNSVNREYLSNTTGISETTISRYINGTSTPSVYNMRKLAKSLNCTINDLKIDYYFN